MDRHILNRCGFSLIELSIVMGVAAVLATAVLPLAVRSMEIKAAEKTIAEVVLIQSAAQKFLGDQRFWPTDLRALQAAGYVSPRWSLRNPWNKDYVITSTSKTLSVTTTVPANLVPMLLTRLPLSSNDGLAVTSAIGGSGNLIAPGVIVAWVGLIVDIPPGWALCDGTNGTPDLRDKFIVGAKQDDGGSVKTNITGSLTTAGGWVNHNHGAVTGAHQLTIAQMPRHHHGYMATPWTGARYDGHSSPLMTQQVAGQTDDTGGNQAHDHSLALDSHLPPYYALAFIMKLP